MKVSDIFDICAECGSLNLWEMDQWFEHKCKECGCRESLHLKFPVGAVYVWQEEAV